MPFKDPDAYREYQTKYHRQWRENNRDKARGYVAKYTRKNPEEKEERRLRRRRAHHRNKVKVLEMYGTVCAYCGCDKYEALCVDHKHDNGNVHRKTREFKSVNFGGMFGYCAKRPFRPDLYQILCHNCNFMKFKYGVKPGGHQPRPLSWWKEMSKRRGYLRGEWKPVCTS